MLTAIVLILIAYAAIAGLFCHIGIRVERYRAGNGGKFTARGIWKALW